MVPRIITAELTDDAIRILRLAVSPKYPVVYMHHCTLAYKPHDDIVNAIEMTAKENDFVVVRCNTDYWKDGVQAVHIDVFTTDMSKKVFCVNKYPHITISTDGKPPKASNDLLANIPNMPIDNRKSLNSLILPARIVYAY